MAFAKIIAAGFVFLPICAAADVSSFLNKAVLVQQLDDQGKITNQYLDAFVKDPKGSGYISQSPDANSFGAFGICLNENGQACSRDISQKAEFNRSFSVTNGRRQLDPALVPPIQDMPITATTAITSSEQNFIMVRVDQKLLGGLGNLSARFRISRVAKLSGALHSFIVPAEDKHDRRAVSDVESRFRDLSRAVVQLQGRPDSENLLGSGFGSGTGYFISPDGLMMTNHHVIDGFRTCTESLICEIDFNQVLPDGSRRSLTAKATLLVLSRPHDFALLKVELPLGGNFSHLELETAKVGPDLMTLGYPGDFREGNETRLTFSFGNLVAFHSRAYATSAYINEGASGSPVLNKDTLRVVAILSNGAGSPSPGIGSPGLARPMLSIDAEFGISDYVNGSKLQRVRNLLADLNEAADANSARKILDMYLSEKTLMGLNALKGSMVSHRSVEVRMAILVALEKMKVVTGSVGLQNEILNPIVRPQIRSIRL